MMLDWRRWTVTHSCGWPVELALVELALGELALGLGVAAMKASCEAESVLDDADPDGDEDEDPDPDEDEPDPDGEGVTFSDADGELG